ncbi:MAG: Isoprenylcysteine carboxyl methyltransferase [Parcubacteria group bacterium LiPW_41]|nr:MAG: Isoprenylcysteine carboxyl methyltransferase [Parcubacteria group bacterium LiPW_41]
MNIISPKTMWSLIILIGVSSFFIFDHEYLYIPDVFSKFVFIICVLSWLTLICSAFFVHREAYKNSYATSRVVNEGIYRKMKHPMYVADILLFIGIAFLFPMMWILVTSVCAIFIFIWFMNIENQVLEERFGSSLSLGNEIVSEEKKTIKTKKIVKKKATERKQRISKPQTKKKESIEV